MHTDRSAFLFLTFTLFLTPHSPGWLSDMFEVGRVLDDEWSSEVKTSPSFRFNAVMGNWGIGQFHRPVWGWKSIIIIKWLQNLSGIDFASPPGWSCRFQGFVRLKPWRRSKFTRWLGRGTNTFLLLKPGCSEIKMWPRDRIFVAVQSQVFRSKVYL